MNVFASIKSALPYSQDVVIRRQLEQVIDTVTEELEEVGYEPDTETLREVKHLQALLDDFDENNAVRRAELTAASEAGAEMDEESED